MLNWLKELFISEVRQNARRYDLIIGLLREQAKAINIFDRKVDKRMSELSDAVAAIASDVTELQAAQQRVIELLTKPNPDVQSAVAALQNADSGFDAIRDALNAAGSAETPTEPPAEG